MSGAIPRPIALTGTPGTGKSTVGRLLRGPLGVIEVSDLARRHGAAQGTGRDLEIDLARLRRALRPASALREIDVIVGHLAHLLPVRESIVLRCHPVELLRRLRRSRRGSAGERHANFVCEATDVIVGEALEGRRPVFEVDTTARTPDAVARAVQRRVASGGPTRVGTVDWLADPAVTTHLLDRDP
ncbi:MAG: AAA family ATPase [Thermoplasmata archaeon]